MILDDIVDKRREQLSREKMKVSFDEIKRMASTVKQKPISFKNALLIDRLAVIAEVKKASPSKGLIREAFVPLDIAAEYERAGVNAMSILTEEHFFQGSSEYLKEIRALSNLPILRKDFIIDEYQIYESKVLGANAILLIVSVLEKSKISEFIMLAKELKLDCLVEVHNEQELSSAIECGADIFGINNRNLKTFEVDISTTKRLIPLIPGEFVVVSESGINTNDDMKQLKVFGANAVLVGETFMRSSNITASIHNLRCGV